MFCIAVKYQIKRGFEHSKPLCLCICRKLQLRNVYFFKCINDFETKSKLTTKNYMDLSLNKSNSNAL